MTRLRINDKVFYINKEKLTLETHIVVWVYNLTKVRQDSAKYFFDAPKQLISLIESPQKYYSEDFHNKDVRKFLESWVKVWPIEKHSFKNIEEEVHFSRYFYNENLWLKELEKIKKRISLEVQKSKETGKLVDDVIKNNSDKDFLEALKDRIEDVIENHYTD